MLHPHNGGEQFDEAPYGECRVGGVRGDDDVVSDQQPRARRLAGSRRDGGVHAKAKAPGDQQPEAARQGAAQRPKTLPRRFFTSSAGFGAATGFCGAATSATTPSEPVSAVMFAEQNSRYSGAAWLE